jgi:hypothetical protein
MSPWITHQKPNCEQQLPKTDPIHVWLYNGPHSPCSLILNGLEEAAGEDDVKLKDVEGEEDGIEPHTPYSCRQPSAQ